MRNPPIAYQQNPWLLRLFRLGWEDPGWGQLGQLQAVGFNPQPDPPGNPEPRLWRVAVSQLVQAAQAKDLATRLPEGQLKSTLVRSAGKAIASILDDWCGTPPRYPYPWPWPGPAPWIWEIAAELSLVANSLQTGGLRDGIEDIAGQVLQKANIEG